MVERMHREEKVVIGADLSGMLVKETEVMRWPRLVSRKITWKDRW